MHLSRSVCRKTYKTDMNTVLLSKFISVKKKFGEWASNEMKQKLTPI